MLTLEEEQYDFHEHGGRVVQTDMASLVEGNDW